MTNTDTQTVLIQDVESFKTLGIMGHVDGLDEWLSSNSYGIVSLDRDADGRYDWVALVAPEDGPDFLMDSATGEMEPVEKIDPAVELAAKMEIALELEDEESFEINPTAWTPPREEAPKAKVIKRKKASSQPKAKVYEPLRSLIVNNPGIARTLVFSDAGLQSALRNKGQRMLLAKGDKLETKRWNRRLNFLIRQMRRDGIEIAIERKGRIAHYTIAESVQLELPFTPAAEARNSFKMGTVEENLEAATPIPTKLITDPSTGLADFEALLAELDDEAVANNS